MDPLTLDSQTTALVLIDLQNGVAGRSFEPHSAKDVIDRSVRLAAAWHDHGGLVVYVHVRLSEFKRRIADVTMMPPNAAPPPPEASELVSDLDVREGDLVIAKRQWGAFYGTELDQKLSDRGIKTIVITGIATNFGVESTARAAQDSGYDVVFVEDAMSTMGAEAHEFAIKKLFPLIGRVRSTEQVIEGLS